MEKLVRDKIPEIIRGKGEVPQVRELAEHEVLGALRSKLLEEAHELVAAKDRDEIVEELADIKEVYDTILGKIHAWQDVTRKRRQKACHRGCFDKGYMLTMPD